MSNLRETITDHIFDVLELISTSAGYNTNPVVYRKRQHWVDTVDFPSLYLHEGEPENVEDLAFGLKSSYLNLIILGRHRAEWIGVNEVIEDIRKILDSVTNTYKDDTSFVSVSAVADSDGTSTLKEFQINIKIFYSYAVGAA